MNREIIINHLLANTMDLPKQQLLKYTSNILKNELSENPTKVITNINKEVEKFSDLTMNRLCSFFICNYDADSKLSRLRAIDFLISNGQKVTHFCIKALEIALSDKRFELLVSEIFVKMSSELNEPSINHTVNENLLKSIDILEKYSRNNIRLQDISLIQITKLAPIVSVKERIKIMRIFKNLSESSQISNFEIIIINFLENSLSDSELAVQKLTINTLKNITGYKPSKIFFSNLDKILQNHPLKYLLKKYLKVSVQQFLHIIHVLVSVDRNAFDISDIESKPIDLICRELLCHHLLAHVKNHDDYDKLSEFKFYLNLTKLEKNFKNETFSMFCDDILLFFIENDERLKLNEINNIILSMSLNFYEISN